MWGAAARCCLAAGTPPPLPPPAPPLSAAAHRAVPHAAGNTHDKLRIERQTKEREEQHKDFEEAKKKLQQGQGLRQFGAASTEVRRLCGWHRRRAHTLQPAPPLLSAALLSSATTHAPLPLHCAGHRACFQE